MKDTIITILLIAVYLFYLVRKEKKKAQKKAARRVAPTPVEEPPFTTRTATDEHTEFEPKINSEKTTPVQETEPKFAKKDNYFTYETLEPEISNKKSNLESYSAPSVNINVQNVDYEQEKKSKLSFETDEIYKGIIYAEILKRPYNE